MTNKLPVVGKRYRHFYTKEEVRVRRIISYVDFESEPPHTPLELGWFNQNFEELPEDKAETKPETQSHISQLSPEVKEAMEELKKILIKESDSMFFTVHQSEYTTEVLRLTCHAFNDKAKKLLNALDKQFKVNETSEFVEVKGEEIKENKIYWSDEKLSKCGRFKIKTGTNSTFEYKCNVEDKEQSIWKPVSEEVDNQSIIFINKAGYARLAEAWNDKFYFIEGDAGGRDVRSHMIDKTYYGKKFCTLTDFINDYEKLKERLKKLEEK